MSDFPGPLFEALGVSSADFLAVLDGSLDGEVIRRCEQLTNGLIYELVSLKTLKKLQWNAVLTWISALTGEGTTGVTVNWFTGAVNRLKKKRADCLKDKNASSRCERVQALLEEPFVLHRTQHGAEGESTSSTVVTSKFENDCLADVTVELHETKDELAYVERRNELLLASNELYRSKLRNIRKRFSRSKLPTANAEQDRLEVENLLLELSTSAERLEAELHDCKRKLSNEHQRVYYHRTKSDEDRESVRFLKAELSRAKHEISECHATNCSLEDEMHYVLDASSPRVLETKIAGQYTSDVRQCCLHLLSLNVGIRNVAPVIRAVLSLVGKEAADLPSSGLLSQMFVELKQVSSLHIAEELLGTDYNTMHSDGTSKFGKSYGAYEVSTPTKVFTLGVVDMECGTADHTLQQFKQVMSDIDEVAAKQGRNDVGKKIVAKLKNTMSDRCGVQKKFNELVEAYRSELLPEIVAGWVNLSVQEQVSISRMNNFFCGTPFWPVYAYRQS